MNIGKIIFGIGGALLLCILALSAGGLFEHIDSKEAAVFQSLTGNLVVKTDPGWKWQGFASVTKYKRSFQYWFTKADQAGPEDERIKIRYNDGGHATISGSVRVDISLEPAAILDLHRTYGSQTAVENELIRPIIEKSVYMTGPLMSSKESYSEKRNELIRLIEDQASLGVYQTSPKNVTIEDPLTREKKQIAVVDLKIGEDGRPLRQEQSPIVRFRAKLYNLSINSIDYDPTVEAQIKTQQEATMNVQTAIANAKKAEQDKITAEAKGAADAATAKWEQEKINARSIAEAEGSKKIAEQKKLAAEYTKQEQILLGQGEAERKKLVMEADGALEKKLEAYVKVNQLYAEALKEMRQPLVPSIIMGGAGAGMAGTSSIDQYMQILAARASSDLDLNLKMQKK
jgi:regulator of protease activity HflC (stomatin/prohibitin superfamily)